MGAYQFRPDEPVAAATVRIARKLSKAAMKALARRRNPEERVHEARIAVKKLRALLRLLDGSLGNRCRREDRRLRDLGHILSPLRDAEVLIQTFDRLFEAFPSQLGSRGRRARLTRRLRDQRSRIDLSKRLRQARAGFRQTRKRAKKWAPRTGGGRPGQPPDAKDGGWKLLAGGLKGTYRGARRAMARAYRTGEGAQFHEWRKAVKYHGHHVRLLADVWPDEFAGRLEILDRLGELLGQDHDLAVLAEAVQKSPGDFGGPEDQRRLADLIAQRQEALRAMARPLGRRLFAEAPGVFRRRVHAHWRLWRGRSAPGTDVAMPAGSTAFANA